MKVSLTILALASISEVSADGPGDSSAEACIKALGGSLTRDQLRWAFTSYSLKELNENGWNFEGVPRPDYISATRYWSELCDGSASCDAACPTEQVIVAGPAKGDPLYDEFKSEILTGSDETYRGQEGKKKKKKKKKNKKKKKKKNKRELQDDGILEPYQAFDDPADAALFVETHPNAISIFSADFLSSDKLLSEAPVTEPLPTAAIGYAHPMTAETCMFALGGLSFSQLRWAFTDWSLAQLQADGWDFTGVPEPDFISPTRYWSELCDSSQPCVTECPERQVLIAGPEPGSEEYNSFVAKILTGTGETVRQEGGDVLNPYVSGSPSELLEYAGDHVDALVLLSFEKFLNKAEYVAASPISEEQGGELVTPDWTTIPAGIGYNKGDGSYPLELVVVSVPTPKRTAKRCIATIGGGLTIQQLRWSFTSYSLAELVGDGWSFENEVPTPDLVSETRYWSELCDGSIDCVKACPPVQVHVGGPAMGTSVYADFASIVLTGSGETYRTNPILNPYMEATIEDTVADKAMITLFSYSDVKEPPNANLVSSAALKVGFADGDYELPGENGYPLSDIAVTYG